MNSFFAIWHYIVYFLPNDKFIAREERRQQNASNSLATSTHVQFFELNGATQRTSRLNKPLKDQIKKAIRE